MSDEDYEAQREKNRLELEEFLGGLLKQPEFEEAIAYLQPKKIEKPRSQNPSLKRKRDETFKFSGYIPLERRKSSRIRNQAPQYSYNDLQDEDARAPPSDDDLEGLENVVYIRKRRHIQRNSLPALSVPVEEITAAYIDRVAISSTRKVYSQSGTSCHQCRQKTLDSKTYCRSGRCIGVRGQFCGPCLKNRYGEEVVVVLRDPNWECPPCRDLCNCSICRTRQGKRPTGILAPIAQNNGYNNVKDFLLSLKGLGDFKDEDSASSDGEVETKTSFVKKKRRLRKKKLRRLSECDSDGELEFLLGFDEEKKAVCEKPQQKVGDMVLSENSDINYDVKDEEITTNDYQNENSVGHNKIENERKNNTCGISVENNENAKNNTHDDKVQPDCNEDAKCSIKYVTEYLLGFDERKIPIMGRSEE